MFKNLIIFYDSDLSIIFNIGSESTNTFCEMFIFMAIYIVLAPHTRALHISRFISLQRQTSNQSIVELKRQVELTTIFQ